MEKALCTFCEIIAGRLPSRMRYEDDTLVVFENLLDWVPVMLLVVPREHVTQTELWTRPPVLSKMGSVAVRIGEELCPDGFRVLSNFGRDALQTQDHGHLHVVGGAPLGRYVGRFGPGYPVQAVTPAPGSLKPQ
jgi:histidine triad (HIT) family protein